MKTTKRPSTTCTIWKSFASITALVCALLLLSPAGIKADDGAGKAPSKAKDGKAKAPAKVAKMAKAKAPSKAAVITPKVVVTGTRIPRQVKGAGNIRETTSPVYIVDRKEIERTGAMTVADVLRRLPFAR